MGSLASRPKAPAVQTVYTPVYVPAPAISQNETGSSGDSGGAATETPPVSEEQKAGARRSQNLLERNRGAFGTILTGFRGVLNNQTGSAQRKTLLGE